MALLWSMEEGTESKQVGNRGLKGLDVAMKSVEEGEENQEAEKVLEVMVLEAEQFWWSVQGQAMRLMGKEEEDPGNNKVEEASGFRMQV